MAGGGDRRTRPAETAPPSLAVSRHMFSPAHVVSLKYWFLHLRAIFDGGGKLEYVTCYIRAKLDLLC